MISFSPASRRPSSTPCPLPSSASCLASRCSIPSLRPPSGSEGAPAAARPLPRRCPAARPPLRPAAKRNAAPRGAPAERGGGRGRRPRRGGTEGEPPPRGRPRRRPRRPARPTRGPASWWPRRDAARLVDLPCSFYQTAGCLWFLFLSLFLYSFFFFFFFFKFKIAIMTIRGGVWGRGGGKGKVLIERLAPAVGSAGEMASSSPGWLVEVCPRQTTGSRAR